MKKIFLFLAALIYLATIIVLRKYPENHTSSFLSGFLGTLGIAFFMFMITKKQNLKKK
jgi:hypothetical protein